MRFSFTKLCACPRLCPYSAFISVIRKLTIKNRTAIARLCKKKKNAIMFLSKIVQPYYIFLLVIVFRQSLLLLAPSHLFGKLCAIQTPTEMNEINADRMVYETGKDGDILLATCLKDKRNIVNNIVLETSWISSCPLLN